MTIHAGFWSSSFLSIFSFSLFYFSLKIRFVSSIRKSVGLSRAAIVDQFKQVSKQLVRHKGLNLTKISLSPQLDSPHSLYLQVRSVYFCANK